MTKITVFCEKCKERKEANEIAYTPMEMQVRMPCGHHVRIVSIVKYEIQEFK